MNTEQNIFEEKFEKMFTEKKTWLQGMLDSSLYRSRYKSYKDMGVVPISRMMADMQPAISQGVIKGGKTDHNPTTGISIITIPIKTLLDELEIDPGKLTKSIKADKDVSIKGKDVVAKHQGTKAFSSSND